MMKAEKFCSSADFASSMSSATAEKWTLQAWSLSLATALRWGIHCCDVVSDKFAIACLVWFVFTVFSPRRLSFSSLSQAYKA
jgi:hypothetical protein